MSNFVRLTMAIAVVCLGSCAEPAPSRPNEAGPPAMLRSGTSDLVSRLKTRLPELLAEGRVPGMSISLIRDGNVVWNGGFGVKSKTTGDPVTPETIFEAASLTKPLFAYLVLLLVDKGTLELDKPLVGYLPTETIEKRILKHSMDLSGFHRDWFERITARHALSHSSGMPHGEGGEPYPLFFEPGTQYRYSADGYYFLQLVVEHLMKAPLEQVAQDLVLAPLGMSHSSLVWKPEYDDTAAQGHDGVGEPIPHRKRDQAHAAATLYTTAAEYARFVIAVLEGRGLKESTWKDMLRPQIPVRGNSDWGLGFGLQTDGNGVAFWQWGDYVFFRNFVIAYPDHKVGVVYLTNSYNGLGIARDVVAEAIGGKAYSLDWLGYPAWDSPAQQFTFLLLDQGGETAIERIAEFRRDPQSLDEGALNNLGYQLLNAKRFDDAISVFELNVKENPDSANACDSLADAFVRRGGETDKSKAIKLYKTVLEKITSDTNPDKDFLKRLGDKARNQLAKLESAVN